VREELKQLDPTDRRILLLTLVEGLKPAEIADRLGLSAEVVRARKSRAVKKIVESTRTRHKPDARGH
jgi:RNA polymerase sigma-70 factor (ECF subfamily)